MVPLLALTVTDLSVALHSRIIARIFVSNDTDT